MKSFETEAGKKIEMFIEPRTSHIKLKFVPGGMMPEELTGIYTSERAAEKDIIKYLEKSKEAKVKAK
jgi:Asp/Glu/hydantoin racemase